MRCVALILGGLITGCQPGAERATGPAPASPQPDALGLDYAGWPKVTETPYPVAPQFVMMCAPPTPEQLRDREAQKQVRGPHTQSAIVVRVNPVGLERFKAGTSVPAGTVVIKEKYPQYSPNSPPVAVAAMIKHEAGYDPEHGDWEYAYEQRWPEAERKVVRGKLETCIECHKGARSKDYLFRPYLRSSP